MEKFLTIVIPTYNMEKYLDKCLTSLIIKDNVELMNSFEVLVIIDGAKDRSSEIAHSYQNRYPNTFRVIDKENGNYGSCVNRGLHEATGQYIKILDADDYFDNQSLIDFLNIIKTVSADLILSDYNIVDKYGSVTEHRSFDIDPNVIEKIENIQRPLSEIEMHAITYRRQMLIDMDYKQTEGISYTDTEWAYLPLKMVNDVYYIRTSLYQYLVGREGQTMDNTVFIKNFDQMLSIYKMLTKLYGRTLYKHKASYVFYKRLYSFYVRYFSSSIIERIFPNEQAIEVDEFLKTSAYDIYINLEKLEYSKIRYMKLWRDNQYKLPYIKRLLILIIRYKQKYFPKVRLGRL